MSERHLDGVFGFDDEQQQRHTIGITAATTGQVDSRGRYEWSYTAADIVLDEHGKGITNNIFEGTIHADPTLSHYGLLSRIISAIHVRVIEQDADEYMARKNANNND